MTITMTSPNDPNETIWIPMVTVLVDNTDTDDDG
jgi:hypothetical protein